MTVHPFVFPPIVYHATTLQHIESIQSQILINRPNAKLNLDFGKGFYTSTTIEQAISRASDLQEGLRGPRGVLARPHRGIVLQFDLDVDMLYNIDQREFKVFSNLDEEWANFIVKNRTARVPQHSYKWTYGGMADGPTSYLCSMMHRGDINIEQLLYGYVDSDSNDAIKGILPYKDHYDQLVFHDETFVNTGVLTNCKLVHQVPNLANMSRRG